MTTDKALEILEMSEQARWREGYEGEDVKKAVETIRKALQSKCTLKRVELFKGEESAGICYYDESRLLIITDGVIRSYLERHGYTVKMRDEEGGGE